MQNLKLVSLMALSSLTLGGGPQYPTSTMRISKPSRSKQCPFSSTRQDARHQRQGQRMVMVNGFEIMNRS